MGILKGFTRKVLLNMSHSDKSMFDFLRSVTQVTDRSALSTSCLYVFIYEDLKGRWNLYPKCIFVLVMSSMIYCKPLGMDCYMSLL